ncbi:RusA-like holliday junction resolvase [Thiohalocapsa phage LS06-2018-MD04]|nr:RusA-like holliday junction resolvase [Thiohalocapsa phage LS06-2018-MD04]
MTTPTIFTLADPATLKVLLSNVPKTYVCSYLQGLCVDPSGYLVATDGFALAEYEHPSMVSDGLSTAVANWLVRNNRSSLIIEPWKLAARGDVLLEVRETELLAHQGGNSILLNSIDGTFPDWRRVSCWQKETWPAPEAGKVPAVERICVNPHLLTRFAPRKGSVLKVEFDTEHSAMRISSVDHEVRGTLMPVRMRD